MTDRDPRNASPRDDGELIDSADDLPTPSQGGTSGGGMQREIGARDEDKTALGGDPTPTSVHKGDRPDQGDEPTLPNRTGGGDAPARDGPAPRRT